MDTFSSGFFFGLNGVYMVPTLGTMKRNQRTIKVYDTSHALASKLSNRFGVSMAALVEIAIRKLSDARTIELPARDPRGGKINARRALA